MEKLLEHSIKDGNKAIVLQLLNYRPNINVRALNEIKDTVLHLIFRNDKFEQDEIMEIFETFLRRGVDINALNEKQETALHLAMAKSNINIIDYLLKRNARIDMIDDQGNSVAHYYVKTALERLMLRHTQGDDEAKEAISKIEKDSAKFVEWLLQNNFDFDLKNKNGQSALHLAIEHNLRQIIPTLLMHTKDIDFVSESNNQTLLQSFLDDKTQILDQHTSFEFPAIRLRQTQEYDYSTKIRAPSNIFSKNKGIEIVKILLEKRVNIEHEDKKGLTSLHQAIDIHQELEIAKLLLDRSTTTFIEKFGVQLACSAIKNAMTVDWQMHGGYLKILEILIDKGVDVNAKDDENLTPVYRAIQYKYLAGIDLMKTKGADFNFVTKQGDTLLHALAEKLKKVAINNQTGQEKIFEYLIEEGCDVNAKNNFNQLPLHKAIDSSNVIIIRKLIEHGTDINYRMNEKDGTPLHMLIAKSNELLDVVELFLDKGADVNCQSHWYGRPIHLAAHFKKQRILKLLLARNAEVNLQDSQGNSALAKAIQVDCVENVDILLAYGADINDDCVLRLLHNFKQKRIKKRRTKRFAEQCLLEHSVKLKAARLLHSSKYENFIKLIGSEFYQTCVNEVETLKKTLIDSHTSVYQWLHMDPNRRYVHSNNEKLQALVNSPTLSTEFPQYSCVITGYYHQTRARRALLEPMKKVWLKGTQIDLPGVCMESIFSYLNTGYMFGMIESQRQSENN